MKRFLALILAVLYLSTSVGATVHLHYCMGKLISWGLVNHDSKKCDICGMQKENGRQSGLSANKNCCRDEHKSIATGTDTKINDIECRFTKTSPDLSVNYFQELPSPGIIFSETGYPKTNAPPFAGKQQIFLLNRNFRI